jgi:hypothetical protein
MRIALALASLTLLTACSSTPSEQPPAGSPSPSSSSAPTELLPVWETRLPAESPRSACPTEATFQPTCLQAILEFKKAVDEIRQQAGRSGARYAPVNEATADVTEAIGEWTATCATSAAGSSARVRCVTDTLGRVLRGDEAILAAIRSVEGS